MYTTENIAGHEVNLILSKDGLKIRKAYVLVGPSTVAGWRQKDGPRAQERRHEARDSIASALKNDPRFEGETKVIRVIARYNELMPLSEGVVGRLNANGKIKGIYA